MTSLLFTLSLIPPTPGDGNWYSFFTTVLPYLTGFGLAWKCVDKVFEYFGKRSKEQMESIAKSYITPLIDSVNRNIDELREERRKDTTKMNEKLKDIQNK